MKSVALLGVTVIPVSDAAFTVSVAVPDMDNPTAAVMVVVPAPTPVANPLLPPMLLMVATDVFEELQTTAAVMSCVEPSSNVPVAVNWSVVPAAIVDVADETIIDVSLALLPVSTDEPDTPSKYAVMFVVPADRITAYPFDPTALLTVATAEFEETQVARVVRSCVEPSE